ncbi:hypothetical protein [Paenibacillus sp. 1-18]|uniref:hypothetical protein n=1 Tax=Paenibacillus sp. 1-18 TaxID=1333846 RepID=UPI00046EFF59|nr:hypothetical protein [Paenibacillus sp. 1-18]
MNYLKGGRICCMLLLLISCVVMNGCTKGNDSSKAETIHALPLQNKAKMISDSKRLNALVGKLRIINNENIDSEVRQKKIDEFTQGLHLLLNKPESVEMKDGELVEKFDNNLTILTKSFQLKSGRLNVRVVNYRAPTTVTGTIGDKYTFIQWWSTKQLVHAQMIEDGGPELATDFIVRNSDHGTRLLLGGYVSIYHPNPVFVTLWELSGQKWTEKKIAIDKMKLPDSWELNKDVDEFILENRQHDSMSIEVLDHGDGFLINSDDPEQNIIIEFSKSREFRIDSAHSSVVNGGKLDTNQYEIEESQSFQTTFEGFGKVQFVSTYGYTDGFRKYFFFLLNKQGHILYSFPKFYGNNEWVAFYGGVKAVAFKDVNNDGLKDVIIIANVDSGIGGPDRIDPFPIADIYFQNKNKTFTTLPALDQAINDKGHNQTIKDVIQYVSKQRINVN